MVMVTWHNGHGSDQTRPDQTRPDQTRPDQDQDQDLEGHHIIATAHIKLVTTLSNNHAPVYTSGVQGSPIYMPNQVGHQVMEMERVTIMTLAGLLVSSLEQ